MSDYEYTYMVHADGDWVGQYWARNAQAAMRIVRKGGYANPGQKLTARRYSDQMRPVSTKKKVSGASAALRQRYAEALQENARLKSPRRAPLGPVRRLPGGENHRHGPGPRRCPKCGV